MTQYLIDVFLSSLTLFLIVLSILFQGFSKNTRFLNIDTSDNFTTTVTLYLQKTRRHLLNPSHQCPPQLQSTTPWKRRTNISKSMQPERKMEIDAQFVAEFVIFIEIDHFISKFRVFTVESGSRKGCCRLTRLAWQAEWQSENDRSYNRNYEKPLLSGECWWKVCEVWDVCRERSFHT